MRKNLLLLLILLFSAVTVYGQIIESKDFIHEEFTNNSYSKVYGNTIPSNTKFSNVKEWIAKTFGDYKSVLQYEDSENYKIIIKGISVLEDIIYYEDKNRIIETPNLSFTLTIDCKDDKYRLKFEDMSVHTQSITQIGFLKIPSDRTFSLIEYTERGIRQRFAIVENLTSLLNSAYTAINNNDDW